MGKIRKFTCIPDEGLFLGAMELVADGLPPNARVAAKLAFDIVQLVDEVSAKQKAATGEGLDVATIMGTLALINGEAINRLVKAGPESQDARVAFAAAVIELSIDSAWFIAAKQANKATEAAADPLPPLVVNLTTPDTDKPEGRPRKDSPWGWQG